MKLLICGSRTFPDFLLAAFESEIESLPIQPTVIITGNAKGADRMAWQYAIAHKIPVLRYIANWKKYGRGAGMIRNTEMVKDADMGLAFWDGESRGTKDTITKMQQANKPIRVYFFSNAWKTFEDSLVLRDIAQKQTRID